MAERDTYKYHIKRGGKIVHRGITYDLARRAAQHQEQYPGSNITQIGRLTTREAGLKWERQGGKRRYLKR